MDLRLRKFNPAKMADDKVCVFIGKRNTGKSTLVTDILWYKKHLPAGIVLSATEEGNHYYQQYIPDLFIYGDYDREAIERVMDRQRKLVGAGKTNCGAFLLLDDCMYDNKFMRDTCIRQCFMNGRHWKIFFMLTMQYCMDLPPALRANVDYVFVLRENIIQNREKLYKSFFGIFPSFDMCKSNRIEDCVFWYKAKLHKNFKVGAPEYWHAHKKMFNPKRSTVNRIDPKVAKKSALKITKTR